MLNQECSAIIKTQIIKENIDDPGSFTLPCTIGTLTFSRCFCDLGASVNLMPLSVAKKLGFQNFKKNRISLVLVDRSVRHHVGMLEDLSIVVGNFEIATDFVVPEMEEEPKDHLIMDRPFLATAEVLIDVKKGKINLKLGNKTLKFEINKLKRKPTINGQVFCTNEFDTLADELFKEFTIGDPLHSALTVKQRKYGLLSAKSETYEKLLDARKSYDGNASFLALEQEPRATNTQDEQTKGIDKGHDDSGDDWSKQRIPGILK